MFVLAAMTIAGLVKSLRRAQAEAEETARIAEARRAWLAGEVLQRAAAEEEVRSLAGVVERQRQDLQAILEAAPVAIWVAHDRECSTVTGNRPALALFGPWERSKEVRVSVGGVDLSPEDRPLVKAAATGEPALGMEFELVSAAGKADSVLSNAVPLFDPQGEIAGAVSIWADVTRLKAAEAEVRRLNADLETRVEERTEELRRALGELSSYAYSIAHDLRAPLRAMSGLTQLLVEESGDRLPQAGAEYAARIIEASRQMDEMIVELLLYSRISREDYPMQVVDPHEICADVIYKLSEALHRRNGEVIVDGPTPPVFGHRDLLREVFMQLLSNAIKFVPEGTEPRLRVRSEPAASTVRIWFEDNGIGIRPEYRERIFGVIQKLHLREESAGAGIGLAIVRRAVERVDGHCGVESEPGGGSRFWIELPAASKTAVNFPRAFLRF